MSKEKFEKMKGRIPEDVREHHKKAHEEMRESIKSLFPKEFIEHRKAARKEMLLAAQGMINHAIDKLEEDKK